MFAWHYTTYEAFQKILKSGALKSRALLIGEQLKSRPDWPQLKTQLENASCAEAESIYRSLLPDYMLHGTSFLRHKPIIWFSKQQYWENQAVILNETKGNEEPLEPSDVMTPLEYAAYQQEQMCLRGGGLVRLGLFEERLLSWIPLMKAAEFDWKLRKQLVATDTLEMDSYNQKFVMGLVADSIPLPQIDRIDEFKFTGRETLGNSLIFNGEWVTAVRRNGA